MASCKQIVTVLKSRMRAFGQDIREPDHQWVIEMVTDCDCTDSSSSMIALDGVIHASSVHSGVDLGAIPCATACNVS